VTYEEFLWSCLVQATVHASKGDLGERDHRDEWRIGQTIFNTLRVKRPELAERATGAPFDAFYFEDRVPAFLDWIRSNW
jgi:hypothetical protein